MGFALKIDVSAIGVPFPYFLCNCQCWEYASNSILVYIAFLICQDSKSLGVVNSDVKWCSFTFLIAVGLSISLSSQSSIFSSFNICYRSSCLDIGGVDFPTKNIMYLYKVQYSELPLSPKSVMPLKKDMTMFSWVHLGGS